MTPATLVRGVLLGILVWVGCADDGGPRLVAATPPAAARNAMVTLTGSRLCGARGDCAAAAGEVQLGLALPAVRAVVISYSDTAAQIVIPPVTPLGPTTLLVTVNERSSNALDFEVVAEEGSNNAVAALFDPSEVASLRATIPCRLSPVTATDRSKEDVATSRRSRLCSTRLEAQP